MEAQKSQQSGHAPRSRAKVKEKEKLKAKKAHRKGGDAKILLTMSEGTLQGFFFQCPV